MSRISTYLEDKLGNHTFRNTAYTTPGTAIYMSLHTADPGETGASEASGGSYARLQYTNWSAPANRAISNAANIGFTTLSGNLGTAVALGIWDASTSGNFLWRSSAISLSLTTGSTPTFEAGNVIISLSEEISTYLAHKWLNHTFRNTAFTSPGTALYTSLHTSAPGLTGAGEVSGNNYGRIQHTSWSAFSSGQSHNTSIVQFATPSGTWGTLQGFGIYDASTSGNFLAGGSLTESYEALASDTEIAFGANEFNLVVD
jgi:hypothetical protein